MPRHRRHLATEPTRRTPVIRAGRRRYVQHSADLAAAMGISLGTFRNRRPYAADGFPPAISAPDARVMLWDSRQTEAHLTGRPVPELPQDDSEDDLLDRSEAAALLGVTPKTWDSYKTDPHLAPHLTKVKGVEHCPRGAVQTFRESRALAGRPKGSRDRIPRDEILPRVGELLDADAALTSAAVQQHLGVSAATATRALTRLRAERLTDLLLTNPALTPADAAGRLGYPANVQRAVLTAAATELRARRIRPYLQDVADALAEAGLADRQDVRVQRVGPDPQKLAAAVTLTEPGIGALVWDEGAGWRTAASRRNPIGKTPGCPPEGDKIHYLGDDPHLAPADLLKQLEPSIRTTGLSF
ncbi:hypothetical protein ACFY9F_36715 [Streptomyces sp. NPDC012421]|uniref:hypothetical protein n=1 Tax=Streptomyces sp. NPDC012421 TaxID=3364832 RepID=UPI0036EB568E